MDEEKAETEEDLMAMVPRTAEMLRTCRSTNRSTCCAC